MKKVFVLRILFWSLILGLVFQGTHSTKAKPVQLWPYKQYFSEPSELKQNKNGLSIEVEPMSPKSLYDHPEFYSFISDNLNEDFKNDYKFNVNTMFPEYNGKRWNYIFGSGDLFLTVFKIKINNNTGHILKMADAKILLRIEGEDPIKPVTKLGNTTIQKFEASPGSGKFYVLPQSAINKDESLVQWVTGIEADYEKNRKKSILTLNYPIGLSSQIIEQNRKSFKLISDVNVEILPDDSYTGILLFPYLISAENLSLKLYEFATKTDAAGNVVERSNFDFKFKMITGNLWYDRNNTKWVDGNPPQSVEYFDKTTKTWKMGEPTE